MSNPLDQVATVEPTTLVAGNTWAWKRPGLAGDYPPAAWTLTYAARREGASEAPKTLTATESGDDYSVTVTHTESASWAPGTWHWAAFMTRTGDGARVTLSFGQFEVAPNPATSTVDPRSHAQRLLDAIEALLENRTTSDASSYSIAGRSVAKMSPAELVEWRDYYRREVRTERRSAAAAKGLPTGLTSVVSFG